MIRRIWSPLDDEGRTADIIFRGDYDSRPYLITPSFLVAYAVAATDARCFWNQPRVRAHASLAEGSW